MTKKICIIGAGVIGLATAWRVAEKVGENVLIDVLADKHGVDTTSSGAGALWEPFAVEHPAATRWGEETFEWLMRQRREYGSATTGIILLSGYELFTVPQPTAPSWSKSVLGFRHVDEKELRLLGVPDKFIAGWFYTSCLADMMIYLPWMKKQIKKRFARVVTFQQRHVNSIEELTSEYHTVINCSGFGARTLVHDDTVYARRGQTVKVDYPHLKHFFAYDDWENNRVDYLLPRPHELLLGGTVQIGNEDTTVSASDTKDILERTSELVPDVKTAPIVKHWAGLRPCRPTVRVESEIVNGCHVIHNYGHGGAGITLHWGSAGDAANIATTAATATAIGDVIRSRL
jgi:glycine/D-amino acid oxidase-like deaminating enzyme